MNFELFYFRAPAVAGQPEERTVCKISHAHARRFYPGWEAIEHTRQLAYWPTAEEVYGREEWALKKAQMEAEEQAVINRRRLRKLQRISRRAGAPLGD